MKTKMFALSFCVGALILCIAHGIYGAGLIRQIPDAPPPVVVPEYPAPPPAVTPTNPPGIVTGWRKERIWQRDGNWKVKFIKAVPRGRLISIFDRKTRKSSELWEQHGGVWKRIYAGSEETLGMEATGIFPATTLGGKEYITAEHGANFLVYDHASGRVSKGARIPAGYVFNVESTLFQGEPIAGAQPKKGNSALVNMRTGEIVKQLPFSGLIAGMAAMGPAGLLMAVSDGDVGLWALNGDRDEEKRKPSTVAVWPEVMDRVFFGSMLDGRLFHLGVSGDARPVADLRCSKINHAVLHPELNALILAGSKPDTFALLWPDMTLTPLARFEDERVDVSGQQFDSVAAPGPDRSILIARERPNGAEAFLLTPTDAAPVPPAPEPPVIVPAGPDYDSLVWLAEKGFDLKGYRPAPGTFKAWPGLFDGKKPGIFFETTGAPAGAWRAVVAILRDGAFHAGPFDGLGDINGRKFKSWENIYGGTKGGPLIGRYGPKRTEAKSRAYMMPRAGETIWISAIEEKSKTVQPFVPVIYPERDR